jgi:hypothetical protein
MYRRHWLEVARARAGQHPADVIPVLEQEILRAIEGANRSAYHAAAKLAKELRGYAERAGESAEFAAWMRTVRADNTGAWPCRTDSTWRTCHVSQPPWWLVTAAWPNQPRRKRSRLGTSRSGASSRSTARGRPFPMPVRRKFRMLKVSK